MTRRLILTLAALVLLAGACGDDDGDDAASEGGAGQDASETDDPVVDDTGDAAGGDAVTIQDFAFEPDSLEVGAGTTVSWSNEDSVTHTVTSGTDSVSDGTFDESVESGASVDIDFDEPGTYPYFCAIHPDMTGEVVVS